MIGNLISILFSQWATTSSSHSLCDLTGSTDKVATKQSSASSSSYFRARRPISVVQTGVKSAGWENRIAHLPFFHSWKDSKGPWVVSAPKSGTMFPRRIALEERKQWELCRHCCTTQDSSANLLRKIRSQSKRSISTYIRLLILQDTMTCTFWYHSPWC